jgi:putative FmdB family regulatory protein
MPTYDYQCDACGHKFEEFQYFSEQPLKTCPKCHTDHLRRLFGIGAAVLFKGSGFYETDYRSDSYKAAAKADSDTGKTGSTDTKGGTGAGGTAASESSGTTGKSETNAPKSAT